jgi:hypothetical protein
LPFEGGVEVVVVVVLVVVDVLLSLDEKVGQLRTLRSFFIENHRDNEE